MPLHDDRPREGAGQPEATASPRSLVSHLSRTAILLDIDGTLLDLAPTPREVWVPPDLANNLDRLLERTSGALALVSGRSLNDIERPNSFRRSAVTVRRCVSPSMAKPSPPMRRRWIRN